VSIKHPRHARLVVRHTNSVSTAALAVVAALGAAVVTAVASLGVMWLQEHLRTVRAAREALAAAVTEMLAASLGVSTRARTLGDAINLRGGGREMPNLLELNECMARDLGPLNAAWSRVWAHAEDQELIRRANALLSACGAIVGAATKTMPAATIGERAVRAVKSDRRTPQMEEEYQAALTALAHAREQLAQRARILFGKPSVELFGHSADHEEAADAQPTAGSPTPAEAASGPEIPAGFQPRGETG
jgi:hypothetical protein